MTSQGVTAAVPERMPAPSHSSSARSVVTTSTASLESISRQSFSQTDPTETRVTARKPERRQGLSSETFALAEQILLPEHEHLRHEKAVLLSGGLRWLLESTADAEKNARRSLLSHGLTESALRTFNRVENGKKTFVVEDGNARPEATGVVKQGRRTESWILDSDA